MSQTFPRWRAWLQDRHRVRRRRGATSPRKVPYQRSIKAVWIVSPSCRRRHCLPKRRGPPKTTRPVMGTAAGFHANECWGQLRDECHHLRAIQPFAQQNRAVVIHTHEVKHLFCDVDAEYAKLLFHWTRLLVVHDFIRSLKSFWLIEAVSYRSVSMLLI